MAAISTGLAVALAVGAGATAGGQIYSAHKQSGAAKRAGEQQSEANREALEFEREQDRLDREEARRVDELNRAQFDTAKEEEQRRYNLEQQLDEQRYGESSRRSDAADAFARERWAEEMGFQKQRYGNRQAQMAPYRASGVQALQKLGAVANLSIRPTSPPGASPTMADLGQGA